MAGHMSDEVKILPPIPFNRTQKVNYMPHQKANRYSHGSNFPGCTQLLTVQVWKRSWAVRSKHYRGAPPTFHLPI